MPFNRSRIGFGALKMQGDMASYPASGEAEKQRLNHGNVFLDLLTLCASQYNFSPRNKCSLVMKYSTRHPGFRQRTLIRFGLSASRDCETAEVFDSNNGIDSGCDVPVFFGKNFVSVFIRL